MAWPHVNQPAVYQLTQQLSVAIATRLQQGDRWWIRQGEETITDVLLLDIAIAGLNSIAVAKVERKREASDGMDWLLNLHTAGGWVVLAVQAKRL